MLNTDQPFLIRYFAIVLLSVLLAGCSPLSVEGLRTSSHSGRIAFDVNTPKSVLQKEIFDISTLCLYGESGVVTQSFENNTACSNITFAFTDFGYYLTTVTIDMASVNDAKTSVVIYYAMSINGRWKRYAEKAKEWALQQNQDCKF